VSRRVSRPGAAPCTLGPRVRALGVPSVVSEGLWPDPGFPYPGIRGRGNTVANTRVWRFAADGDIYRSPSIADCLSRASWVSGCSWVLWGPSVINLLGTDLELLGTDVEEFFRGRPGDLRGDLLVWRDQALLWALHVARVMSTLQIAVELFPGQQACKARSRLNKLRAMSLVERHRGRQSSGSETYLWTLTPKGFDTLRKMMAPQYMDDGDDPRPWSLPEDAKHRPWTWAERQWGGYAIPARLAHDLAVMDFLISYRRHVDSALAHMSNDVFITTEWRTEHAFLPNWTATANATRSPPINAAWEAFDRQGIIARGFDPDARLQVVKPDAALSIIINDPGEERWVTPSSRRRGSSSAPSIGRPPYSSMS
jgi:hypothetical protein